MRVPTRQVGNKKGVRPWPCPLQNRLSWGHFTRFWGKIIIRSGRVHDQFAATPLGSKGTLLEGVLIDQAIEVLFECTRHFGGRPGRGRSNKPCGPCWAKRCTHVRRAEFVKCK